jgi:hypothetical protein
MTRNALFCGFLVILLPLPAGAQQEDAASAPSATVASPASQIPTGQDPRVLKAVSRNPKHPGRAALGDEVTLEVQGLSTLLNRDSEARCADLVLFLDGIAIQGSPPESCSPAEGKVRFRLGRTGKSDRAWHILLSEPTGFTKTVSVSLGSDAELAYPTDARNFELEVLPRAELFLYFGILAISLALFVHLARKTSILRTPDPVPEGRRAPFSLSRFQLAFWSMLVIAAYLFIWMITDALDTITGSVLVLLGIGSGTALSAAVIDSGKTGAEASATLRCSQGFLKDLLSDDHGISLHRFQLFSWTLVLGLIFCASVYDGLQMPQFSTTLLGLMGLSSGTYLGFKMPEGKSTTVQKE